MKTQLNDLFQSTLVFGLAALFTVALMTDLHDKPSSTQTNAQTTSPMVAQAGQTSHRA
jgi:hypothetical protein